METLSYARLSWPTWFKYQPDVEKKRSHTKTKTPYHKLQNFNLFTKLLAILTILWKRLFALNIYIWPTNSSNNKQSTICNKRFFQNVNNTNDFINSLSSTLMLKIKIILKYKTNEVSSGLCRWEYIFEGEIFSHYFLKIILFLDSIQDLFWIYITCSPHKGQWKSSNTNRALRALALNLSQFLCNL